MTASFACVPLASTESRTGRGRHALRLAIAAAVWTVIGFGASAHAQSPAASGDQLRVSYGPWAYHFNHSSEHVRYNHLVALELLTPRWTVWGAARTQIGFAAFDNSFGQFSQYVWFGQEWDWAKFAGGDAFVTVTAGLLHGYRDQHRDKIPFNSAGIAPVIIPSVGVRWGRFSLQATVLGTNGFLFAGSWVLDLRPGPRMAVPVGPPTGN